MERLLPRIGGREPIGLRDRVLAPAVPGQGASAEKFLADLRLPIGRWRMYRKQPERIAYHDYEGSVKFLHENRDPDAIHRW